jgi:ACS family glucarate transporter-like MFS transporter
LRLVVFVMALSFFGKGVGALGWAVISDAPRRSPAAAAACSHLLHHHPDRDRLHHPDHWLLHGAMVFVGTNVAVAVLSYLIIVGEIKRMS